MNKIGVFLCSCSENISKIIDFNQLEIFIKSLSDNIIFFSHKLLCSEDGQKFAQENLIKNDISHVLIIACSPKLHEKTFMKVAGNSNINPYLLSMANIREGCAYVTENSDEALEKAKKIIKAAFKRLLIQEALDKKEIEINPDVLIIGSGVSGLESAEMLASKNRNVYLIEKKPNIGGSIVKMEDICPTMECATCLLEPRMDEVLHNEKIKLYTLTELKEIKGFAGNFEVTVLKKARYVDETKCLGCGECHNVCPVNVPNSFSEYLNKRKAIYIPMQGALPYISAIDEKNCIYIKSGKCKKCEPICPFQAINFKDKDEEIKIKVGSIIVSSGHQAYNKREFLKGKLYNFKKLSVLNNRILSSYEFERIISQTGPTSGELRTLDGKVPKTFAIIHCAGSRSKKYKKYCSLICCMNSFKFHKVISHKIEDSQVFHIYKDLSMNNKYDMNLYYELYNQNSFIRTDNIDSIEYLNKDDKVYLKIGDKSLTVDMVILMTPIEKNKDNEKLKEILEISTDEYGFFKEDHNIINPSGTELKGIYIAGTAQGPKNVPHSIAQSGFAAGQILSSLIPGEKMVLEAITAKIDEDKCSSCKICISLCPYKAISFNKEKNFSEINEVLCHACGVCSSACPSGAITAAHFKNEQILTELEELY